MFPCVCVVNVRTRSFSLPKVLDFSLSLMEGCVQEGLEATIAEPLIWFGVYDMLTCVCVL